MVGTIEEAVEKAKKFSAGLERPTGATEKTETETN